LFARPHPLAGLRGLAAVRRAVLRPAWPARHLVGVVRLRLVQGPGAGVAGFRAVLLRIRRGTQGRAAPIDRTTRFRAARAENETGAARAAVPSPRLRRND